MIYKEYKGEHLSALGMGAMRLPTLDGDDARIDEAAAEAMVDRAMAAGVNYFDTAWGYHAGNSERVMGRALAKYPRASFYLADKFPGYDLANMDKVEAIFEKQLEKCRVDYFDFYLFHNVCEMNIDATSTRRTASSPTSRPSATRAASGAWVFPPTAAARSWSAS